MDKNTTARVESWTTFKRGDDTFMLSYLVQNGQQLTARSELKTLGPVTYMDRQSELCQIDGHLYRLGTPSDRSRSLCKRISAQKAG